MAGFVNFGDQKYANITMAVGSKEVGTGQPAANQKTDMMLVYFLMHKIRWAMKTSVWKTLVPYFRVSPKQVKWSDKSTEKNLSAAIQAYQNYRKIMGQPIFPDGRVDSLPKGREGGSGSGLRSTITHTVYTMAILNDQFIYSIQPSPQPADFIIDDALKLVASDIPFELFVDLFTSEP
jgi:hypothetical protein